MNLKPLVLATVGLASALPIVVGQQSSQPTVFTGAQAEAGRVAYEKTCGYCHTLTLLGRKGDSGEAPPLSSLSTAYQEFIQKFGPVPALAGPEFVARWRDKTVAQVITRIQEAVGAFPPEGMTKETAVEITAYALQVSGAKPGPRPLTRTSDVTVGSLCH
jgi:mono/diheme cytochrome c family protein